MRRCLIFLYSIFWASLICYAQNGPVFLFEKFSNAKVHFKNHALTVYSMNYDANKGKMYFLQNGEIMELMETSRIDTISWGNRKFIPGKRRFLEVQKLENGIVYIDWLIKDVHLGKKGVFGLPSQGSIQNLKSFDFSGGTAGNYTPYNEQKTYATDMWKRKNDNTYYILVEGKLTKVKTLKHLKKIFPKYQEEIQLYVKENNIDMRDVLDILNLLNYCLKVSR